MASFRIEAISVPKVVCPLVETVASRRITYFSNSSYEVLRASKCIKQPTAIPHDQIFLDVTLAASSSSNITITKTNISLQALYQGQHFLQGLPSTVWDPADPATHTVRCFLSISTNTNGVPRSFPWMFRGPVTWNVKVDGNDNAQPPIDLEIYVLPTYLPKYFVNAGIPLGLLRLETLLPVWMAIKDPTQNSWPAFAITALFNDSRLTYDIFSGAPTYGTFGPKYNAETMKLGDRSPEVAVWLELWLSDMYGLSNPGTSTIAGSSKFTKYPINCFDTATVGQAIASLGLPNPAAKLRMIHMEPYGYIKPTRLIGRHKGLIPNAVDDLCNNPLYGMPNVSTDMLCADPLDPLRSSFGRHFYLTIDSDGKGLRVLDACAGPHIGTESLPNYIDNAIDFNPGLYKPTSGRSSIPGKLSDTFEGHGVVNLATASSFTRGLPQIGDTATVSLFGRMFSVFSTIGTLKTPFEGSPSGVSSLVATWTYIDNSAPNKECQISIWRYGTAEAAKNAYLLKRSFLAPGWVEISAAKDSDLTYTDPGFGYRMFWTTIPAKPDNNFLVMVEGSMTNTDINARVATPILKRVLDPNLPLADNTTIQDVNIQPGPYKVDSTFTITILPSATTKPWWRGYKAESAEGNVLFVNSRVDPANENVELTFYARRPGHDNIYITLYGPNLDSAQRAVGALVVLDTGDGMDVD